MNTETWRNRNPFTDEFMAEEVTWYGRPAEGVRFVSPQARCDDYLNVNFRLPTNLRVPILVRDGTIWMSLTWIEVQSAWLAILRAHGHAATIGLGLGYFALRAAQKPEVDRLTVFEIDEENIAWFRRNFADRDGFDKIEIVAGDAMKTCKGRVFDTLFNDRYPALGGDDVIEDARVFRAENEIADYRFWGYERVVADACEWHDVVERWSLHEDHEQFFEYWEQTDLSQLRRDYFEEEYVTQVLDAMDWDV